jgi:hypothetical protein
MQTKCSISPPMPEKSNLGLHFSMHENELLAKEQSAKHLGYCLFMGSVLPVLFAERCCLQEQQGRRCAGSPRDIKSAQDYQRHISHRSHGSFVLYSSQGHRGISQVELSAASNTARSD